MAAPGARGRQEPKMGGTDFADTLAYRALTEGYNVVELNYCLMTEHVFPDQIVQLNRALHYLRENADELVYDHEASRLSNVIDNVTANFPPCLISDGNSGSFFDQAFAMNGRCIELGVESKLAYFPQSFGDLPHGYEDLGSDQARIVQDRMIEFMAEHA